MNIEVLTVKNARIFTEEPEQELWRSILQFSYKANILRYYDENGIEKKENDDILANSIAGALLQADEIYKASKTVSLQVEPLSASRPLHRDRISQHECALHRRERRRRFRTWRQ